MFLSPSGVCVCVCVCVVCLGYLVRCFDARVIYVCVGETEHGCRSGGRRWENAGIIRELQSVLLLNASDYTILYYTVY